jgi:polyisoprenoid-binding protein YceI
MSVSRRATLVLTLAAALAAPAAFPVQAAPATLLLDPAASRVSFTLDATGHDVEGTMAVKSGRVTFDSAAGTAGGEIVLDLASAQTGNQSRDKTMHEEVLETGAHPTAVFRPAKLRGTLAPSGPSQVTLDGTLSFHGAEHAMSLPAKVEVRDGKVTAETSFTIPYVEWGLHDPSLMILRVAKKVAVQVVARGTLE